MPKGRILAVDDQRYFRELLEGMLTEEGFEAQTASSGEEALRMLEHSDFEILITDLVMPGMDGNELVHRVKERNPNQDIVVITGVVDVRTAVDAMKLGATDYLLKPFDRKTLATALEGIMQNRRLRDEHARLLAENIDYLAEHSLLEWALRFYSCLSVSTLAERVVEGLCVLTKAQGGVLWISDDDEPDRMVLAAARGLVRLDEEPAALTLEDLPPELREGGAPRAGGGAEDIYLPLRRQSRLVGVARLTDRLGGEPFGEGDRSRAEKLLGYAEPALANALRVRTLERRSLRDPATGAYIREYLDDVARNEIEKANRFGRSVSVFKLELGPLEELRKRLGPEKLQSWRAEVANRLQGLLRATDVLAVDGETAFCALLPEADALGAAVFKQRARRDLESGDLFAPIEATGRSAPQLATATYPIDGTQFELLAALLDTRIEEESRSLVGQLGLDRLSFAEALEALLRGGKPEPPETAGEIARFVLGELGRRPRDRGLVFVAPGPALADAVREGLEALGGIATRTAIAVVADGEKPKDAGPAVTWLAPDRAPDLAPFLLHYGEGAAYLLVRDADDGPEGVRMFHSDDRSLVEHLAFRLQRELAVPQMLELAQERTGQRPPAPGEGS